MLGKLIKHEWKDISKMGCLMLGAMVMVTFLGWLAFRAPMWDMLSSRGGSFSWLDIFSVLTLWIYVMLLACVSFSIQIYLGVRFYRTMYTDQGYLTHTLPVTKNQILVSKILVGGIWQLFIVISIFLSLMVLGMSMVSAFLPEGYSLARLWGEFSFGIWDLLKEMETWLGFETVHILVVTIATCVLGPFAGLTVLFGAISLGQLVPRGRLLMGIVFYIAILVVEQIFASLLSSIAGTVGIYFTIRIDFSLLVNLLTAAGLYAASYFVVSRRLNLV